MHVLNMLCINFELIPIKTGFNQKLSFNVIGPMSDVVQ